MTGLRSATFDLPVGLLGRLGGMVMAHRGAATERFVAERLARLRPTDVVLVIGPGPGIGLVAAAEQVPSGQVVGVEPSAVMRAAAARRCAPEIASGLVELGAGTAAATGRPGASVDVVLTVDNLHLWPDRAAAFAEFARVLRPGGRVLAAVPGAALPVRREELRQQAAGAGFADTRVTARPRPGDGVGSLIELTGRLPSVLPAARPETRGESDGDRTNALS